MDIISYSKLLKLNKRVDGVSSGIENATVDNESSSITFNFVNGTSSTMTFPVPSDGISITNVEIDTNNHLIVTYSDNSTSDAGLIETIKGDKGDTGIVPHIDDETKRWFIGDQDTGYVAVPNTDISFNDLSDIPTIPVAVSQLSNDENFIKRTVSNLINYLPKDDIYSKDEVNNLISNINRLTVLIVSELPTTDISTSTIYLIAAEGFIYNQHMYIEGEWANLGNTSINLEEYVTIVQLQDALIEKSDINHTHDELHNHGNFPLLETITAELIQKWNSKFSGNYNDLTNKPNIPIVTNDLTNELKEKYDTAWDKSHEHNDNISVLDKFSEDVSGKPLYNGSPIIGTNSGSGTVTSVNDIIPDEDGNIEITAKDIDTYDKVSIDNKIGNALNIQYINPPLNSLVVKSGKSNFDKEPYPILNKNMVIFEDDDMIKFIVSTTTATNTNTIFIRTMDKNTYEYTDEDTENTYSIVGNQVGYEILFVDSTYCYLKKTDSTSNNQAPINMYRLNYTEPSQTIESRANFPKAYRFVEFVKYNNTVYGFGGSTNASYLDNWDSIWKYDIADDNWIVMKQTLPNIIGNFKSVLTNDHKVYMSFGYQSNNNTQWSQKYAWYFDIPTETVISIPDRSSAALRGCLYYLDNIGLVTIATVYRSGNNYKFGQLGNQLYIPEINQWVDFNLDLPFKEVSSSGDLKYNTITILSIKKNTIHLLLDNELYSFSLDFTTLGIYSKLETVYITTYTKSNKDVEDVNGNIILAGIAIEPNTEIKILEDDTRLVLLSNITTNGSWVRRPPTKILGMAEETTLWEGSELLTVVNNVSTSINKDLILIDDVLNYDEIRIYYNAYDKVNNISSYFKYETISKNDIVIDNNTTFSGAIIWSFSCMFKGRFVAYNRLYLEHTYGININGHIKISKIVGVKYKTS